MVGRESDDPATQRQCADEVARLRDYPGILLEGMIFLRGGGLFREDITILKDVDDICRPRRRGHCANVRHTCGSDARGTKKPSTPDILANSRPSSSDTNANIIDLALPVS
jgi:hypothetical protein